MPNKGRGGRGLALQYLLQKKGLNGHDNFNEEPEAESRGGGDGIDIVQNPEFSRAHTPTPSIGRGKVFSEFLNQAGPSLSRGRGFSQLLAKQNSLSSKSITPDPSGDKNKVPASNTNNSSSSELNQSGFSSSFDKLQIKAEPQTVTYHGASGTPVPLRANCVRLRYKNQTISQYSVMFTPLIDSMRMKFALLKPHEDIIGTTKAFDGTILYIPKKLPSNKMTLISKRLTDNADVTITITFTKSIDPSSNLLIPFYSTVLRRCMNALKMCPVGRNHYDPQSAKRIDQLGISLWPGYVTAIRGFEGGLLLNIDVSHKVLRSETVHSVMKRIFNHSQNSFMQNCIKELVGAVVLTRYNNKNYRIDDIAWKISPSSSFTNSKGESITFEKYYQIQYQIDIEDMQQPMLIHRPKRVTQRSQRKKDGTPTEICLVPELCYLTGLSDNLRNDFKAMRQIKDHTCLPPSERNASIEQFLYRIQTSPAAKNELLRWGLEIEDKTTTLDGRVFPSEAIRMGNNVKFSSGPTADFSREVAKTEVLNPVNLNNWILCFTRRDAGKSRLFFSKLVEVCGKLGMRIGQPHFVELQDDRSTTYKDAIASNINREMQLVVCIFPTSRDDRYSALKKLCCVDMPVPSQVILSRTLPDDARSGKFRSVTAKIALQINCKLGGELWAVEIPLRGLMVCGIDVYHDASGRGNSVAAFVASLNKYASRWYSKAIIQRPRQEVIDGLKHSFTESLKKYYEVNNALPERIIIYRDGVGDGQLRFVADHEMPQLISCFGMFEAVHGAPYNPKFTVVIVSKRINIRFFQADSRCLENPNPGTVLDHTITRQTWPDFYLVSQHVRHGTVSPTHYIVVHGHTELKPDHIQRLSYKLTHMYYNWPGTIRVPAPCQYAHKLAYLVGQNIRAEPSQKLCDRLFYL